MRDDDDLDLSAWEAPPPPAGLADAVIARMAAPHAAAPVEPTGTRRAWWVAVGGAVALAAIAAVVIVVVARTGDEALVQGERVQGDVVADQARHVVLGGTAVDLDAGAALHWQRERDGLRVTALRGTSAWQVAATERLRIDTGAMGVSVEATGASLRVEVTMNQTDAKIMGTGAIMAAAAALVSVVVYDGHVQATSGGKTVVVAPGASVALAPVGIPRVSLTVRTDERVVFQIGAEIIPPGEDPPDDGPPVALTAPGAPCDAAALEIKARQAMSVGANAAALLTFEQAYACKPAASLIPVLVLVACRAHDVGKAKHWFSRATPGDGKMAAVEGRCLQLHVPLR